MSDEKIGKINAAQKKGSLLSGPFGGEVRRVWRGEGAWPLWFWHQPKTARAYGVRAGGTGM